MVMAMVVVVAIVSLLMIKVWTSGANAKLKYIHFVGVRLLLKNRNVRRPYVRPPQWVTLDWCPCDLAVQGIGS